ncbi:hypothetical protein ACLI1A_10330 [Flavobacterium sp. RHBU_3]|uniref:hypothetical protein n=1 Tax=Flavobacterium sp. RHBU_3 TaxID=3391184 RepID=UPI00398563A2
MRTIKTGEDCTVEQRPITPTQWLNRRNMIVRMPDDAPALTPGDRIYLGMERCETGKNSGGIDEVYAVVKNYDARDIRRVEGTNDVEVTLTVHKYTQ